MKLPQTIFIKHCPNLSPERKTFLIKHLEERVPIKDIRWVEDYNHTDLFVRWINKRLSLPYGLKLTSNMVKSIMSWKMMIDENIESAIFMDDDVVFHKDWVSIFESIQIDEKVGFINLGLCLFYDIKPKASQLYQIPNNAGCESMWCNLKFIKTMMENLNINQTADIVFFAIVHHYTNQPLLCLPICHQTSGIENDVTLDHDTVKANHWKKFMEDYKEIPKIDFNSIFKEFESFKHRKHDIEKKFFELYGKKVDLKHYDYITKSGEHNSDLLTFN
jgi:hypothetical protein